MLRTVARQTLQAFHVAQYAVRKRPNRFIFLIGHMRSGSSLLTHILNTNPAIVGYGETSIKYSSLEDLKMLVWKVHMALHKIWLRDSYILDKVLHDYLSDDVYDALQRNEQCYFVFQVREPEGSIKSMMNQFPTWFPNLPRSRDALERKAAEHYDQRMMRLMDLADRTSARNRTLFLTYSQLLSDTNAVFRTLEHLLRLKQALTENYDLVRTTGVLGTGDPSPAIRKGHVDRTLKSPDLPVDPAVIENSRGLFDECCRKLRQRCVCIATGS